MKEFAVVFLFWLGMFLMGAGTGISIVAAVKAWRFEKKELQ